MRALILAAFLLMSAAPSLSVEPSEMLPDAALEARAQAISKSLRCVVCQNETIDDSDAPLAHDMRMLVRQRLIAGDSDAQVRAYLVARYGDFVLLKPPVQTNTFVLWATPFAILAIGLGLFIARSRKRAEISTAPLSPEERQALNDRLGDGA